MKRLYVLGCSFMSDDLRYPDEPSFTQQFAQRNGYEYHCLARPGATNFAINLQADEAIQQRADLIVIGCTSSDRMNIALTPTEDFEGPVGLQHIVYDGYDCSSAGEIDTQSGCIASDTVANLLESRHIKLPKSKQEAVKHYVAELHDVKLQYHIDLCVMRDTVNKLLASGIPFVFIPGPQRYNRWHYLGHRLWPQDRAQPWDIPAGPSLIWNHNPPEAHQQFLETLETILPKEVLTST